jgi:hypothetical protein
MKRWLFSLSVLSLLELRINAQPAATLQARSPYDRDCPVRPSSLLTMYLLTVPQTFDRPGFVPEVTSLIASLWDDGIDGLLGASKLHHQLHIIQETIYARF